MNLGAFGARLSLSSPIAVVLTDDDGRVALDALGDTTVTIGDDNQGPITEVAFRTFTREEDGTTVAYDFAVISREAVADVLLLPFDRTAAAIAPAVLPETSDYAAGAAFEGEDFALEIFVNAPPSATGDVAETDEDTAVTIDVLANDSDPDGDALSLVSVGEAGAGSVGIVDGRVVYTPDADANGTDSFTYTISDGSAEATGTVEVAVAAVNDAPVASDDSAETDEDAAVTIDVLANDGDVDGDALNVVSVGEAGAGSVRIVDGRVIYTPDADANGTDSFTYTISDGSAAATGTVEVTVAPVNDAPVAAGDEATTRVDTDVTIDVLANDSDVDGDDLRLVSVGAAGTGSVRLVDGRVVYTPGEVGQDSFDYTITDGSAEATATVSVTVTPLNTPPAAADDTAETDEDTPVTIDVLVNDSDVDGNALSLTAVGTAGAGSVRIVDGRVLYTPDADANGTDSFTYTVSDGTAESTATVSVSVAAVNDAPAAAGDRARTDEDTPVTIDVLSNDSDVDGDSLSLTAVGAAGAGSVRIVDGRVLYTPDADTNGEDAFTYTVSDGTTESTATVVVSVTPVDDAPEAVRDRLATREDTRLVLRPEDVLGNDRDVDGDALRIIGVSQPVGGSLRIVDGAAVYQPPADASGRDRFTYTITDGISESTAAVVIDVAPVNDAPVAVRDVFTIDEDQQLVLRPADVLGNDSDVDGDRLRIVGGTGPEGGSLRVENGTAIYTPPPDTSGRDRFTYTISDGEAESTATVIVRVRPVNDAPVARDDAATTAEDRAVRIDVLDNDSDVDGGRLRLTGVGDPGAGSVRIVDNAVVYTPDADASGGDSFTYTVSDGSAETTASVRVTVTPANDAPVAADDSAVTEEDRAVAIDVLANDRDIDGDGLSIVELGDPGAGSVRIGVGGRVIYTPDADTSGRDSFTYAISDGTVRATATVNVTVAPVNDLPVATDDSGVTDDATPLSVDVLANDTDADGDALSLTGVGGAVLGTAAVVGGEVLYTPTAGATGTETLRYTVSDGSAVAEGTLTVRVEASGPVIVTGPDEGGVLELSDAEETVTLGAGATELSGGATAFFGDRIAGFGFGDSIVIRDATLSRDALGADRDTGRLALDLDGDGRPDGAFVLDGDYSGGAFMAVATPEGTRISFEPLLPLLTEKQAVPDAAINGVSNPAFLTGTGSADFAVTLADLGAAGFDNAVGVYEVTPEGAVVNGRLLFRSHQEMAGETVTLNDVAAGHRLGFFIVADGAEALRELAEGDALVFVDETGGAPDLDTSSDLRLTVRGTALGQPVYHSIDAALNPDGLEHVLSGASPDGRTLTLGFEDLPGRGDRDFEDVGLTISVSDGATVLV